MGNEIMREDFKRGLILGKMLREELDTNEKTNLSKLEITEFDSVSKATVYLGGLDNLQKINNELSWHVEYSKGLGFAIRTLTLKEVFDQVYEKYGSSLITVFINGPMHGEIYQCGNYEIGDWVEYGSTIGYA